MPEHVYNSVYEMRSSMGITQEGLAREVGVSRQTVIAIEKGNYVPSVLLAMRIAKFFRRPVEEIFFIKKS
ncbi:MAG TPA: helix-turn-helix transcriptional regulator [Candidatus Paceibacterota bacterium]|nr:helix-turn-helix transcriptional regulator [Candidatus Paceibacterota bacterium]